MGNSMSEKSSQKFKFSKYFSNSSSINEFYLFILSKIPISINKSVNHMN